MTLLLLDRGRVTPVQPAQNPLVKIIGVQEGNIDLHQKQAGVFAGWAKLGVEK